MIIIIGIVLFPLWGYLFYGAVLWLLGYELTSSPTTLAQKLVEQGRPARDCLLLKTLDLGPRPTTPELRGSCIYTYASLTKDPTACELLLPGEYGLACIANLWPQALPDDACDWSVRNPTIFECRHRDGPLRRSSHCSDFADNPKQFSACIYFHAMRERNIERCSEVTDLLVESLCKAKMNAWLTYPELRGSFYFGKPVPID